MTTSFKSRRRGRFAAVQALYQLEQRQSTVETVISEFNIHRFPKIHEDPIDLELFQRLVEGTHEHKEDLNALIAATLTETWRIERLDAVLRAILRAGFFELQYELETPVGVIINDYVEITKEFFNGREPAFINGALDNGSRSLRKRPH